MMSSYAVAVVSSCVGAADVSLLDAEACTSTLSAHIKKTRRPTRCTWPTGPMRHHDVHNAPNDSCSMQYVPLCSWRIA